MFCYNVDRCKTLLFSNGIGGIAKLILTPPVGGVSLDSEGKASPLPKKSPQLTNFFPIHLQLTLPYWRYSITNSHLCIQLESDCTSTLSIGLLGSSVEMTNTSLTNDVGKELFSVLFTYTLRTRPRNGQTCHETF